MAACTVEYLNRSTGRESEQLYIFHVFWFVCLFDLFIYKEKLLGRKGANFGIWKLVPATVAKGKWSAHKLLTQKHCFTALYKKALENVNHL